MVKGGKKTAEALRLERRRFARFNVEWPVEYPLFGETAFANTENISRGGMLVTGVPIIPEDEVEFSLHGVSGVDPLLVVGRVCRTGDSGTHVEFVDVAGDPGPTIERFIEHNIIPGLIGSITGERRDTQTLRLVSSWYRELGKEDRALDVCRGAIHGASSAGPYEELASLLITRAKRLGVRGGLEHIHEARQVIGQGLKLVASPVLVRMYQESMGIEEQLRAILTQQEAERLRTTQQQDVMAELGSITSEQSIPPELLAAARRTDLSGVTDPSLVATNPELLLQRGASSDPGLPAGLMPTDPALPVRPATVDAVAAAFAPLTDPMLAAPAPRTTESVSSRPRRRGRWLALVVLLAAGAAGFWLWRSGTIRIPALEVPTSADVSAEPDASPLANLSPPTALDEDIRDEEIDEEQYANLVELEPDLLSRPPDKKGRRKGKRRARRSRRGAADLFDAEFAGEPVAPSEPEPAPPVGDRYARAKEHFKARKILLAIEELEALTGEQPRHADAYRLLGVAYSLVGREPSSIEAFRQFIKLAPAHKHAVKIRAIIADFEQRHPGE